MEKRLDEYIRKNKAYTDEEFEKMTYLEKLKLFQDRPEEYERLLHKGYYQTQKPNGMTWSSQTRKE